MPHAIPMSSTVPSSPPSPCPPPLSSRSYPGLTSGYWSLLSFSWVRPILDRGRAGPLTSDDLFQSPAHLMSATYTRELEEAYRYYQSLPARPSNQLLRAVLRAFRRRYFRWLWSMRCLLLLLTIVRPFILRQLLLFISEAFVQQRSDWDRGEQLTLLSFTIASWSQVSEGVYWAMTLAIITLAMAMLNHHFWWVGVQLALTVRGSVIGLLFLKSLRLHWSHRAEYSSGRISNLASVDGDNCMNFMVRAESTLLNSEQWPTCAGFWTGVCVDQ